VRHHCLRQPSAPVRAAKRGRQADRRRPRPGSWRPCTGRWLRSRPPERSTRQAASSSRGPEDPFESKGQIDRSEGRATGRHATLTGRFKTTSPTIRDRTVIQGESGRQDLNLRPLDPQSSALARLRHAPNQPYGSDASRNAVTRPPHYRRTPAAVQHEPAATPIWPASGSSWSLGPPHARTRQRGNSRAMPQRPPRRTRLPPPRPLAPPRRRS
jgi:hypothetical protein